MHAAAHTSGTSRGTQSTVDHQLSWGRAYPKEATAAFALVCRCLISLYDAALNSHGLGTMSMLIIRCRGNGMDPCSHAWSLLPDASVAVNVFHAFLTRS